MITMMMFLRRCEEQEKKLENYFYFKHNEGMKKDDMYLMVNERIGTVSRVFQIVKSFNFHLFCTENIFAIKRFMRYFVLMYTDNKSLFNPFYTHMHHYTNIHFYSSFICIGMIEIRS